MVVREPDQSLMLRGPKNDIKLAMTRLRVALSGNALLIAIFSSFYFDLFVFFVAVVMSNHSMLFVTINRIL